MEPVAIIGLSHRFPGGASTPSALWNLLLNPPTDLSRSPPQDRLNLSKFYHENDDHHGGTPVSSAYFLDEDPTLFDNTFFSISPLEAEAMDPQQRLLLETVYEASERAGKSLEELRGSQCSVFVGVMTADYEHIQNRDAEDMSPYTASGTSRAILANRISYFFDLKGQSMAVDTACSSSLVALHLAVQDLRAGNSDMAVVAGCNLMFGPDLYVSEAKLHMLSPTGTCKMWDSNADGYARGEGVASLFLKPFSAAVRDGDPIQGVIRHTGVNSDGRTQGITMPSATAQAALVRRTYQAAGLNPLRPEDRCQYFEAHGTGTKAGDPNEARGIYEAFFSDHQSNASLLAREPPLFVGSIKTVIGHLEGCAGLAGVIKAVLAMQKSTIPPNVHFNNLNPDIIPYYAFLDIPTKPIPWPAPASGQPKRASVNSFGFGGTNAHIILEGFENGSMAQAQGMKEDEKEQLAIPLHISAHSQASLSRRARQIAEYLREQPTVEIADVAWTLWKRRSDLPFRQTFSGATRKRLLQELESGAANSSSLGCLERTLVSRDEGFGVLGVFTGQGAQWARMGRELLLHSPVFRHSVERCDRALASLPERPPWSLVSQLLVDSSSSRITEAFIAQPATTALEIGLIDMLTASGITFSAVIGHSSGEIAACYASGILTSEEAIRIAFYRGLLAEEYGGKGSMMAAGLDAEAAALLCREERFQGRLWIAAKNSPSSVTLSGDVDAVQEAKVVLDGRTTFARVLHTDKAYHSPHMLTCSDAYRRALSKCGISPRKPRKGCVWISTVDGHADRYWDGNLDALSCEYWIENMLQPVLFMDGVTAALTNGGPYDTVVEIGPHPALKGPVSQTIMSHIHGGIPYHGCMKRGENCMESMSIVIGFLGANFGKDVIDLEGYQGCWKQNDLKRPPRTIDNLPSYPWDHDKSFWRESRISRNYRLRGHDNTGGLRLLGRRCPEDSDREPRWRNYLNLKEIPWLRGHAFQGEALFPAAGHLSLMLEVAQFLARGRPVEYIEIRDVQLERTLRIHDGPRPVEIISSAKVTVDASEEDWLEAEFSCHLCSDPTTSTVERTSAGTVCVSFKSAEVETGNVLPPREAPRAVLSNIDVARFYSSLRDIGLEYDGPFKTLNTIRRADGVATALASWTSDDMKDEQGNGNLFHPALLDTALHPIFAAFTTPSTDRLWTAYLPRSIEKVVVNPNGQLLASSAGSINISIDANITEASPTSIVGDVDVASPENVPLIQLQGVALAALERPSAANDRNIFSQVAWEPEILGGAEFPIDYNPPQDDMVVAAERVALFYARKILAEAANVGVDNLKWHEKSMVETLQKLTATNTSWRDDSEGTIDAIIDLYHDQVDFELMDLVGREMGSVLRNEKQMVEVLFAGSKMNDFYRQGLGLRNAQRQVASYMRSISHRYPRAAILELGAGTAATTSAVFDAIGDSYGSYTFTDVSAGFFPQAQTMFADQAERMAFRKLDISTSFEEQGFEQGTYDVIIAANVLHISEDVEVVLRRVRGLLRAGGYLVVTEPTSSLLRLHVILGGLEGWWLARDGCRVAGPILTCETWDEKLREVGFSGVDLLNHDQADESLHSCTSFICQAIDNTIECIREPSENIHQLPRSARFTLVGGSTLTTSKLIRSIRAKLTSHRLHVVHYTDVRLMRASEADADTYVLYLSELDQPSFRSAYDSEVFEGMKHLLRRPKGLLAVTRDAASSNAFSNILVGLFRGLRVETPSLQLQVLDLEHSRLDADTIPEHFLRLVFSTLHNTEGDKNLLTVEPELLLRDNKLFLPRVRQNIELNNRVNTRRRAVPTLASKQDHVIEVHRSAGKADVFAYAKLGLIDRGLIKVEVDYSTLLPLRYFGQSVPRYLCVARDSNKPTQAIVALSEKNASEVNIRVIDAYTIASPVFGPDTLAIMAIVATAQAWLRIVPRNHVLWIHGASRFIINIFEREAARRAVRVFSTSSNPQEPSYLHPRVALRSIKSRVPKETGALVVGGPPDQAREFVSTMQSRLGLSENICGALQDPPFSWSEAMAPHDLLAEVYNCAIDWQDSSDMADRPRTFPIAEINAMPSDDFAVVVDWTASSPIPAIVKPVPNEKLLRSDKTYFLVGLTGEIGLSICSWMVIHGARSVALGSRNPKVDPKPLEDMGRLGATIRVLTMDVTNAKSVEDAIKEIEATMPPIVGVCNGSMVLADGLFEDMDKAQLDAALNPKVQGSLFLDKAFSGKDLDFFILMSSLGSVIGTPGQANYHMANMFVVALATDRRRRGLAGSVLDVGFVADIGYVPRQDVTVERTLRAMSMLALWEEEVHIMFAEAIIAGRPDCAYSPELIVGLPISDDESKRPHWASDPRFAHFVKDRYSATISHAGSSALEDLQAVLQSLTDEKLLVEKMQDALGQQLERLLQLEAGAANISSPLVALGMDSLLAMEVQRWFRKTVGAEVSVLQILGGASGEDLCRAAARSLFAKGQTVFEDRTSDLLAHDDTPNTKALSMASAEVVHIVSTVAGANFSASEGTATPATSMFNYGEEPDCCEQEAIQKHRPGVEKEAPVSFAQARLWFLREFLEDPTTYNETAMYDIYGPLDIDRFRSAFQKVTLHHEALRTRFYDKQSTNAAVQTVMTESACPFKLVSGTADNIISNEYKNMTSVSWDLNKGACLGVTVLRRSSNHHTFIIGSHHIAVDGVSWLVMLRHLSLAYQLRPLPPVPGYAEFAVWQRGQVEGGYFVKDIDFWKQELSALVGPLPLFPMARVNMRKSSNRYDSVSAESLLDQHVVSKIKQASSQLRITPFHFHLTALAALISRLSGANDICIGTVDAGRSNSRFAETVGFFINIVPIRIIVGQDETFESLCKSTSSKVFTALSNSRVPLDALLDALRVPRTTRYSPLFQVIINYRLDILGQDSIGDCKIEYVTSKSSGNPYDLCLNITETPQKACLVEISVNEALYTAEAAQSILDCYCQILNTARQTPSAPFAELGLPSQASKTTADLLAAGRGYTVDCDWEETVSRRIEGIAARYANVTAVEFDGTSCTYSDLMRQTNLVVTTLKNACVLNELNAHCCLLFQPSIDYVASFLAVLRSSAVAVPLDALNSKERLAAIIDDCQPVVVLYHSATASIAQQLQRPNPQITFIDVSQISTSTILFEINDTSRPDAPATIVYTSGTTGKPKGVILTNANYRSIIAATTKRMQLSYAKETMLQQTALGFDMSIMQILLGLCNANTVVVASAAQRRDPCAIAELIANHNVSCMVATPTEYALMFQHAPETFKRCRSLRTAGAGGEIFSLHLASQFRHHFSYRINVFNVYGPTETCINSNVGLVEYWRDDLEQIPVGPPLDNVSIYVLDGSRNPVAPGCTGEIYVSGCGVGHGYLRRPELSSASFLQNPFATPADGRHGWTQMYYTGDKGFLRRDGTLVVLGRVEGDNQVKLRGIRIELDDIAANIISTSRGKVAQAIVTVRGETQMLVGFAVLAPTVSTETDNHFLETLAASLPLAEYMKPAVIIPLETLPRTVNGKLDRHALAQIPLPDKVASEDDDLKALSPMEAELRQLWNQILPLSSDAISSDSDFFRFGGNSALLVALRRRIRDRWRVTVSLLGLFEASTLRSMAASIQGAKDQGSGTSDWQFWDRETRFDSYNDQSLENLSHGSEPGRSLKVLAPIDSPKTICVTGANTLLGSRLLRLLLARPDVARIYCIGSSKDERTPLPVNDKIVVYEGTLREPSLGLTIEAQTALQSKVDIILHAGAEGSCLNSYSSISQQNVESTRFLAHLAVLRRIPLHYVSSARVVLFTGHNEWGEESVAGHYPPTDHGREGFTATKWASEVLLEDCHSQTQSPIAIHRTGYLISDDADDMDVVNMIHKYSIKLRAIPSLAKFSGFLDISDAQSVAESIVAYVMETPLDAEKVIYKHHTDNCAVPVQDFTESLEIKLGRKFETLPMDTWATKAEQVGMNPFLAEFLRAIVEKGDEARYPRLLKGKKSETDGRKA